MTQKKWMNQKEAWELAVKVAEKLGSIELVAENIECATSTIYRWAPDGTTKKKRPPDGRYTIALKELAIREGIIKA